MSRHLISYQPIDEILDSTPMRLLRALRWFDWVTRAELFDALDLEPGSLRWAAHQQKLTQLVKSGSVASDGRGRRTTQQYRLTAAGREEIAKRLTRASVGEWTWSDEVAA